MTQPHYPAATPAAVPAVTYGPMNAHDLPAVALVLHTTETTNLPGFRQGETAPHYTYEPGPRRWRRWAEWEDGYVGTLRGHTTGGHGNCKAFQVELVGYSNYSAALQAKRPDLWVGHWAGHELTDIAHFVAWARDRYGITDHVHAAPRTIGWRYGTDSPYRLTPDAWAAFGGLTAHGGVPGNTHWDTGLLDLEIINRYATEKGDLVLRELITDRTWKAYSDLVGKAKFGDYRYYCRNDGTYPHNPPWGEGADDGGADHEPGARENAYNIAQQKLTTLRKVSAT